MIDFKDETSLIVLCVTAALALLWLVCDVVVLKKLSSRSPRKRGAFFGVVLFALALISFIAALAALVVAAVDAFPTLGSVTVDGEYTVIKIASILELPVPYIGAFVSVMQSAYVITALVGVVFVLSLVFLIAMPRRWKANRESINSEDGSGYVSVNGENAPEFQPEQEPENPIVITDVQAPAVDKTPEFTDAEPEAEENAEETQVTEEAPLDEREEALGENAFVDTQVEEETETAEEPVVFQTEEETPEIEETPVQPENAVDVELINAAADEQENEEEDAPEEIEDVPEVELSFVPMEETAPEIEPETAEEPEAVTEAAEAIELEVAIEPVAETAEESEEEKTAEPKAEENEIVPEVQPETAPEIEEAIESEETVVEEIETQPELEEVAPEQPETLPEDVAQEEQPAPVQPEEELKPEEKAQPKTEAQTEDKNALEASARDVLSMISATPADESADKNAKVLDFGSIVYKPRSVYKKPVRKNAAKKAVKPEPEQPKEEPKSEQADVKERRPKAKGNASALFTTYLGEKSEEEKKKLESALDRIIIEKKKNSGEYHE